MSKSRAIYLIVATTVLPPLGIGLRGSLPWSALRADMDFFKRVTTDSRPSIPVPDSSQMKTLNAVIMGRKTWDSIPSKFRPLKGRFNIIVTKSSNAQAEKILHQMKAKATTADIYVYRGKMEAGANQKNPSIFISSAHDSNSPVMVTGSIADAVGMVLQPDVFAEATGHPGEAPFQLGNTFVIGGREIYATALHSLKHQNGNDEATVAVRILQTQVRRRDGEGIECDTFFPGDSDSSSPGVGFRMVSSEVAEEWAQAKLPQGEDKWRVDGEMEIRVVGWEKG